MGARNLKNVLKESFWMAIDAIRKNKLRSMLTLLGISIGVFSVIGVMTAIRTLESSVESGLNVFAANTFVVQKYPEIEFGHHGRRKYRNRKNITIDQYKKLKERANLPLLVSAADGTMVRNVKYRDKEVKNSVQLAGGDDGTIRFYNTPIIVSKSQRVMFDFNCKFTCIPVCPCPNVLQVWSHSPTNIFIWDSVQSFIAWI